MVTVHLHTECHVHMRKMKDKVCLKKVTDRKNKLNKHKKIKIGKHSLPWADDRGKKSGLYISLLNFQWENTEKKAQ